MSESKIKVGILGAGSMGAEHANCYRAIETAEVVGVFSRNRERAESAARICNGKPVTDPFALIDDPTTDAVDVCVPSANHREFVIAALKKGKHVFCETPFALQLDDAEAMIEASRKSNRVLQVGLLMRSVAQYEHVHRVAASGEFGKVLSVTTYRLGSYLRAGAADHREHYSDPSTELMTFDFDFVQWLLGPPVRVTATATNTERGTPGEISAVLEYDGNRSATVLASGIMPQSFPFSAGFRVLLERGAFELKSVFEAGPPLTTFTLFPADGTPQPVSIQGRNPYEQELRSFVDCILGKGDPAVLDAERALETLRLSIATQRSLEEHRAIDFGPARRS